MHPKPLSIIVSLLVTWTASVTAGDLPVVSSWIGNTWDGVRRPQMPLTADDIGVSGDGIVAMTTHYNEGGLCLLTLRDGQMAGFNMHATQTLHAAGSPQGTRLFVAVKGEYGRGVAQFTHFGELYDPALCCTRFGPLDNRDIAGLAWRGNCLYATEASDKGANGIWVFDATKWAPGQQPLYKIDLAGKPKPGKIALDSHGDPWVIQANEVLHLRAKSGERIAAVQLPPPAAPAALAVDHLDRLLVADAGADCDIKLFDAAGKSLGAIGAKGGFAAGPTPGLIGPLRFDKPSGLALDADKNLYVYSAGGDWPQTVRLESYAWDGRTWSKLNWKAEGLIGGDTVFLDPEDETRGYNSGSQFKLDWSQPPGKEWSFYATTLENRDQEGNPSTDPRHNLGVWWGSHGLRRIHGKRFVFASAGSDAALFRFSADKGELAVPSLFLAARSPKFGERPKPGWPPNEPSYPDGSSWLWTDSNGNGKFDQGEYQRLPHLAFSQVDDAGNIYYFPSDIKREPFFRMLPVGPELDAAGNPVYDAKSIVDYPVPSGWTKPSYAWIDRTTGDLAVAGYAEGRKDVTLRYYAGWTRNPKMPPTWSIDRLGPTTRGEDWGYDTKGDHVAAVQIHGPYVFVPSVLINHVRIYRRADGALVGALLHTLAPNTTLDGYNEFGVHRRACGEYLITAEDFLQNKCMVYRWMPAGPNLGFESPALEPGSEKADPPDASWTFAGTAGLCSKGSAVAGKAGVAEGEQAAFLGRDGSFYQAFPLDCSGRYALSFQLAGAAGQRVQVLVDNKNLATFTPGGDRYVPCSPPPVSLAAGGHVIKFVATGTGTALVDDVRIAGPTSEAGTTPADNPHFDFDLPVLPPKGQVVNPVGGGWRFTGPAGIAAVGSPYLGDKTLVGKQAAFIAKDGAMSREVAFAAGRHFLRFKAVQSNANGQRRDQDFRVKIDGKQVGVFEPPLNSPCWMMTRVFDLAAGPHTVAFEGLNTAGAAVAKGDNIALIDGITIVDPE
jgi:hypothetical protein